MLTEEQKNALKTQRDESEDIGKFVDSYELALVFFSDESTLPSNLQGLTSDELRVQLNTRTFEQTSDIVSNLRPKAGLNAAQLSSWIWIRGARGINNGGTAYADFIREYTEQQIDFRNISSSAPADSQTISNGIARNLINDLINNGKLPPILEVGLNDASVVIDQAAGGDPAAWAGNPLFLFLGSDIFLKANLLHDSSAQGQLKALKSDFPVINSDLGDTYDLLLSFKIFENLASANISGLFTETVGEVWSRPGSVFDNATTFIRDGYNGLVTQSNGFLRNAYGGIISALNVLAGPSPIIGGIGGFFGNVLLRSIELELDKLKNDGTLNSPINGIVHGADGNDTLVGSAAFPTGDTGVPNIAILDGGSGIDVADYSKITQEITVKIDELDEATEAEYIANVKFFNLFGILGSRSDNLYNLEKILGSPQDDKFEIETSNYLLEEIDAGDGEEDLLDLSAIDNSVAINLPLEQLLFSGGSLAIKNFEFFEGTAKDDIFIADDQTANIIGGDGEDIADFSNLTSAVKIDLDPGFFGSSDISLEGIERVIGTPQNDEINGSGEQETLEGGAGNDTIDGGAGNDTFIGGAGNDTIDGGSFLFGLFEGTDTAIYEGAFADYELEFLPDDSIRIIDTVSGRDGTDILKGVDFGQFSDKTIDLSPGQDIAFVIDTTGSMFDDIAAVRTRANDIIDAIYEGDRGVVDSRIAVVGYNDPGTNTFLSFTDQSKIEDRKTAARNAINSISVGGGGDFPEVVNAGLLRALSGGAGEWREEASARRIILFGDAPPKDTELRSEVLRLAANVNVEDVPTAPNFASLSIASDIETTSLTDGLAVTRFEMIETNAAGESRPVPVEIFTVLIGFDFETSVYFQSLAEATGGEFFNAANASEIVDALIKAIETPVNIDPVANNDIAETVVNVPLSLNVTDLLSNDTDDDGDILFIESVNNAVNGNVKFEDDTLTFTPNIDFEGEASFEYTISDGNGGFDIGEVAITVIPEDDTPNIVDGTSGRDNLTGSNENDLIEGGQGRDLIVTGAGKDILIYTSIVDAGDIISDFEVGSDRFDFTELLNSLSYSGSDSFADGYIAVTNGRGSSLITVDPDGSLGTGRARPFILVEGVAVEDLDNADNFIL